MAQKHAAFDAYIALYQAKLLNDHLLPVVGASSAEDGVLEEFLRPSPIDADKGGELGCPRSLRNTGNALPPGLLGPGIECVLRPKMFLGVDAITNFGFGKPNVGLSGS